MLTILITGYLAGKQLVQPCHCLSDCMARTSVLIALQTWLSETPASKKKATTPAYFTVALSSKSIVNFDNGD